MIYLLIYFALVAWLLQIKGTPIFRFDQFSTLSWLFSTFLGSLGLVFQKNPLSWETILLVMVCHTVMVIAFGVSYAKSKHAFGNRIESGNIYRSLIIMFPLLFVLFALSRSVLSGSIPIISSISSIETARETFWLEGRSGLDQIIQPLIYGTIPFVIYFPFIKKKKFDFILFSLTALFILDSAFRDGGRALIVFVMISALSIFFSTRKVKIRSSILYILLGLAAVYMLASQFYLARNSNFGNNVDFYISYNCNGGSLSNPIKESPVSVQALALSSCYFSSPLHTFDRMHEDWNIRYNGTYNGGIILGDQFEAARRDIENYFASRGLARNPWATSVRDVWLDVGPVAPFVFVLIGILMGRIGVLPRNGSPTQIARFGLVASLAFMMPFQSPFILRFLVYPIAFTYLIDLLVILIRPFLTSKSQKPYSNRRLKTTRSTQPAKKTG